MISSLALVVDLMGGRLAGGGLVGVDRVTLFVGLSFSSSFVEIYMHKISIFKWRHIKLVKVGVILQLALTIQ